MTRFLLGLLFGVALFSLHASAAPYPDKAQSTVTTTTVHVVWVKDYKTADFVCSIVQGEKPTGNILACYFPAYSAIVAVEPTSFNDYQHLMILGHEFWHALGAQHPE